MRKLLMVLSGLLVLSGCSGVDTIFKNDVSKDPVQDKKTTKKVMVQCDHGEDIKTTFEASDDNILQMKQISHLTLSDMGLEISDDMNKDTIQQKINESLQEKYQYVDGVSVKGTLTDDKVEIETDINFRKANKDDLVSLGLLDKAEKENKEVSLKKTIKAYQANGYACQE